LIAAADHRTEHMQHVLAHMRWSRHQCSVAKRKVAVFRIQDFAIQNVCQFLVELHQIGFEGVKKVLGAVGVSRLLHNWLIFCYLAGEAQREENSAIVAYGREETYSTLAKTLTRIRHIKPAIVDSLLTHIGSVRGLRLQADDAPTLLNYLKSLPTPPEDEEGGQDEEVSDVDEKGDEERRSEE
jgi:hypothetical protein